MPMPCRCPSPQAQYAFFLPTKPKNDDVHEKRKKIGGYFMYIINFESHFARHFHYGFPSIKAVVFASNCNKATTASNSSSSATLHTIDDNTITAANQTSRQRHSKMKLRSNKKLPSLPQIPPPAAAPPKTTKEPEQQRKGRQPPPPQQQAEEPASSSAAETTASNTSQQGQPRCRLCGGPMPQGQKKQGRREQPEEPPATPANAKKVKFNANANADAEEEDEDDNDSGQGSASESEHEEEPKKGRGRPKMTATSATAVAQNPKVAAAPVLVVTPAHTASQIKHRHGRRRR